jgi:hypothetical protein
VNIQQATLITAIWPSWPRCAHIDVLQRRGSRRDVRVDPTADRNCRRAVSAVDDPASAGAILMCKEARVDNPEIRRLCESIVANQQMEIDQMAAMLREVH